MTFKTARHVPWRTLSDLEELAAWIYGDNNDFKSKQNAVNRLTAWQALTPLPPALESTLLLLTSTLLDLSNDGQTGGIAIREAYCTAIIRMVNGAVDPLQLGVFARSIASIASQLGLPLWLVELRHAGTHEDLPSLDLLRRGAAEGLSWIERNFFVPILTPALIVSSGSQLPSSGFLMQEYNILYRKIVCDKIPRSRLQQDFLRLGKQLENWLVNIRLHSPDYALSALFDSQVQEVVDLFALSELSKALLGQRCLLSRGMQKVTSNPELGIPENVPVWSELLSDVQERNPLFAQNFILTIFEKLAQEADLAPEQRTSLVNWAHWTLHYLMQDPGEFVGLVSTLFQVGKDLSSQEETTILTDIIARIPFFGGECNNITFRLMSKSIGVWEDHCLEEMLERMDTLHRITVGESENDRDCSSCSDGLSVAGWRLLRSGEDWHPCALGVVGKA